MKIVLYSLPALALIAFACSAESVGSESITAQDQSPRKLIRNPEYTGADTCITLNEVIDPAQELRKMFGEAVPSVSVQEEMEVGDAAFEKMAEEETVTEAPTEAEQVLTKLVAKMREKESVAGFDYKLHFLPENDQVNAFTIGGHIFLTQGMWDYLETED